MKTILFLALAMFTVSAFAEDDLSNIQTIALTTLNSQDQKGIEGMIVKLQFGWKEGDFLRASTGPKKKNVPRTESGKKVLVPEAGKAWFATLPTRPDSPTTQSVYLRLHTNAPADVLGRDLRNGRFVF